jgi:hypothetical protein
LDAVPALAQQPAPRQDGLTEEQFTYFYRDPRPARLVGFIEKYDAPPVERKWDAYPPLVGFFAVIFRKHPDWIERLVPARLNARMGETVTAAIQLAGNPAKAASLRPRLAQAGSDAQLKGEYARLASRLEDLRVVMPTHLDILWGASFASGDGRYAGMIIDFFARTANRSERIAIDVAQTAIALMGGPKESVRELRGRHGDDLAREIIYAATALWALQSNARQHPFVDEVVAKYVQEHGGTPAEKALSALRPKKRG